ncbi:type VII secretion system-associated protein [Streptomyces sp. NPDC093109]|uniref:type VII secretion system-associated protein n=1 Tax=Streptomyces sp. NPDC093109 TaxID=3154977 RepID=UPI00344CA790
MDKKDPNSETKKLSLDKAGLKSFRDNRLLPFKDELRKIKMDDPTLGPTMGSLIGEEDVKIEDFDSYQAGKPLALGFMLKDDEIDGQVAKLNKSLARMAEDLTTIFDEQTKLFDDIEDNLNETLESLFDTQGTNLTKIDGQEYLDIFEDVDDGMGGGGGGGGGGDDDD